MKNEPKEKAILVVSGKVLDASFDVSALKPLHSGIAKALEDRNVELIRSIVTLSSKHAPAAADFLRGGFEASLAEDEDLQTIARIFSELMNDKLDEVVMWFGKNAPVESLRLLAGRTRRTLLTDSEIDDDLKRSIEMALDVRELLSKEGVNCNHLRPQNWDEAQEERREEPVVEEQPATTEIDDLCQTREVDPYDDVKAAKSEWNPVLEEFVLENDKKCSAALAIQQLEIHYPGIGKVFFERTADFRKMLSTNVRLVEEDGMTWFYHATHPDMLPVQTSEILTGTFEPGEGFDDEETGGETPDYVSRQSRIETLDFADVVSRADILIDVCNWAADRVNFVKQGRDYLTEIEPMDREVEAVGRAQEIFMWPIGFYGSDQISSEEYRAMVERYRVLKAVYALLNSVLNNQSYFDTPYVLKTLQLAADAQCLLKTALVNANVPVGRDAVQYLAFKLLSEYRGAQFRSHYLEHMKREDEVDPATLPELKARFKELQDAFDKTSQKFKGIDRLFGVLEYHGAKIKDAKPQSDFDQKQYVEDWNKVVDAITGLVRDYGEPASSLRFRNLLVNSIERIPEEIETTEEFARVRQEIDLYKERESEKFLTPAPEDEDKDKDSSEILAVRRHYGDAKAVFVGGTPTPHLCARIEKKLGLHVYWDEHDHGDSLDRFNRYLNDSEVKLFLVYIPWCSHKHSRELPDLVQKAGKDCVRVRKGTSPEQLANAICDQVSMTEDEYFFEQMDNPRNFLSDDE